MVWVLWLACGAPPGGGAPADEAPTAEAQAPAAAPRPRGGPVDWWIGPLPEDGNPLAYGGARVPSITVALAHVQVGTAGDAPPEVRQVVGRHMNQLLYCYEKHHRASPTPPGALEAHLDIGSDGRTAKVDVVPSRPELAVLAGCFEGRFVRFDWATGPAQASVGFVVDPGLPLVLRGDGETHAYGAVGPARILSGELSAEIAQGPVDAVALALRLCAWARRGWMGPGSPPAAGHVALRVQLGAPDVLWSTRVWADEDTVGDPDLTLCLGARLRQQLGTLEDPGPAEVGVTVRYSGS